MRSLNKNSRKLLKCDSFSSLPEILSARETFSRFKKASSSSSSCSLGSLRLRGRPQLCPNGLDGSLHERVEERERRTFSIRASEAFGYQPRLSAGIFEFRGTTASCHSLGTDLNGTRKDKSRKAPADKCRWTSVKFRLNVEAHSAQNS